jgi:pyruvate dehydrogenase E2 component (dihydrolipoamide acetyltransferase)
MGDFKMPSLGSDMEAGTLVEWLKQPGEMVRHGDIIAVVETEKGAIEIEVFEDGSLDQLLVSPGTKVPVGTVLATISGDAKLSVPAPQTAPQPIIAPVNEPSLPVARTVITVPGSPQVRASPAARKLAQERGIDLKQVHGRGPDGAIVRSDVLDKSVAAPARGAREMEPMRRAIAAAMARSKREIPHYYLLHSFDIGAAQNWLAAHNGDKLPADRILFSALLLKATALALREFAEFNGFYDAGRFQPSTDIHIGVAIAIRGGGLAAPAIHDTDTLSLSALMVAMRDLVGRVRRGGFRSSEISDPTVTVSSLGERGVDALLPVIYPPQVAIIGFGSVQQRPWVVADKVEIMPVQSISLAADHRVSDGHRGALFLQKIEAILKQPEAL